MDKVYQYLKESLEPQLLEFKREIKEELRNISSELKIANEKIGDLILSQERQKGQLKNHDEKLRSLPCHDHYNDIASTKGRVRGLEERALGWQGEVQQAKENAAAISELRPQIIALEKSLVVKIGGEEMTVAEAVKGNAKINRDQEMRRQKAEKNIWVVMSGVLIILITSATLAIFNHFWKW